jgi:hypothetical protein
MDYFMTAFADELIKTAVSGPWIKNLVERGMAKASPERARAFIGRQGDEIAGLKKKLKGKRGAKREMTTRQIQRRQVAGDKGIGEHMKVEEARLRGKVLDRGEMVGVAKGKIGKKGIPTNRSPGVSPTPADLARQKEWSRGSAKKKYQAGKASKEKEIARRAALSPRQRKKENAQMEAFVAALSALGGGRRR